MSSDESTPPGSSLDLGLSGLLSALDESSVPAVQATESSRDAATPADPGSAASADLGQRFETLWSGAEHAAIISQAEANFSSADFAHQVCARLWWVKAQLHARTLPTTALVGALDSGWEILDGDTALRDRFMPLLRENVRQLADMLFSHCEYELALSLIERLYRVDQSVADFLREIVIAYEKRLLTQRGKYGLSALERDRLSHLEQLGAELHVTPQSIERAAQKSPVPEANVEIAAMAEQLAGGDTTASRRVRFLFGGLAVGLLLLIANWWWWGAHPAGLGVGLRSLAGHALDLRLRSPDISRLDAPRDLDALAYQLAIAPPAESSSPVPPKPAPVGTNGGVVAFGSAHVKDEAPTAPGAAQRTEVAQLSNLPRAPEDHAPSAGVSNKQPLSVKGPFEPRDVRETIERVRDRMRGGDPDEVIRRNSPFDRDPVEIYPNGRMFMVVAPTRVLVKPQYRAESIAELNPGDQVKAEEKRGFWLRIRSPKGRNGFILAQDTEELQ